jgi:hypothetical protein
MRKHRKLNRRSFLATVAGSAAAGSVLVLGGGKAAAQGRCSDRDPSDPAGSGRNCTGCSDMDPSDPSGAGRSCQGRPPAVRTGCSDSDPSDPGGSGRNCRTSTACRECSCPQYVSTPDNQFARCARETCHHAANSHYSAD